ncbi:hypothetical protein Tco_1182633 [Tanacetum coccineum]
MMLSWSFRMINHTGTETPPGLPRRAAVGNLRQWAKARSSNITCAWLSSARVVRCLVKSYNERNPRFVLLRHAPKEKVFAAELARLTKKIERAFLAWLVKSSFWPYLAGDDDVELTAEKDWAFRRAARWCVRMALWAGPTRDSMAITMEDGCKVGANRKDCLSSDCSLQLGNMKLESLVIADQHAAVNMYPGPVHTARHTLGIGFARSIGPMITHDFCVPLVPQRLLVVLLAHTTVGSSTGPVNFVASNPATDEKAYVWSKGKGVTLSHSLPSKVLEGGTEAAGATTGSGFPTGGGGGRRPSQAHHDLQATRRDMGRQPIGSQRILRNESASVECGAPVSKESFCASLQEIRFRYLNRLMESEMFEGAGRSISDPWVSEISLFG